MLVANLQFTAPAAIAVKSNKPFKPKAERFSCAARRAQQARKQKASQQTYDFVGIAG